MKNKTLMDEAFDASEWSDDLHTKVGAVIVYNGMNRGIYYNEYIGSTLNKAGRMDRPAKYNFMAHAEESAILNTLRCEGDLDGYELYVTHIPCPTCARLIVQSGIARVVCAMQRTSTSDVDEPITRSILSECGVEFVEYEKPLV